MPKDLVHPSPLREDMLRHLRYTLGKVPEEALTLDWRLALSHAVRDRMADVWHASRAAARAAGAKRVHYLSMEFLIGRLLEDAVVNLRLEDQAQAAFHDLGLDLRMIYGDEPDAALGNGGLGRLAACFMESMATLGLPAFGYGIRYEHGLFRQRFEAGRQIEEPEDWLAARHAWEFERPEAGVRVAFGGEVRLEAGRAVWAAERAVLAAALDTPVVGWRGRWADTLRLW